MEIKDLQKQIEEYTPFNEQEEKDKELMLKYIKDFDNILTRDNEYAHFTASAYTVNKDRTKILLIHHNIYNAWTWEGGHADGSADLLATAIRELKEETGVKNVKKITDDIGSLEILCVWGHVRRGKYVSAHVHLNLTYLLEVDENEILISQPDENSGVKWMDLYEAAETGADHWVKENIWKKKLNKKLEEYSS